MNRTKKILKVLLLVFCMVVLLSFSCMALQTEGNVADGLKWSYDDDSGTLTVSGKGKMENFSSLSDIPWYKYRKSINSVVIEHGVRTIGMRAFYGCENLTRVSLTDSVEAVYGAAFYNCSDLVKINFKGTEFYWDRIKVGQNNGYFSSAMVTYQSQDHIHAYEKWEIEKQSSTSSKGVRSAECCICSAVYVYEDIPRIKKINLSENYFSYTGKSIGIDFRITDTNGDKLTVNEDYTVKASDIVNAGKHKATVIFKGKYTGSESFYYYILPEKVVGLKSTSSKNSIKLEWNTVNGATGYRIYKYNSATKEYEVLVKKTYNTSCTIKNLAKGKNYAFLIKAYIKNQNGYFYSRQGAKIITCTQVDKCKISGVTNKTGSIKLSWNKVVGATGYRVYLYDSSSASYKKLITTTVNSYEHKNLKPGKVYVFALKAYRKAGDSVVWSEMTKLTTATSPEKVTQLSASASVNAVKLSWKKLSSATGYRIYMYNSANKKYEPVKVTNENKITLYDLKAGKKYAFAVRAYVSAGDTVVWGDSVKVTVTTEKDTANTVIVSSSGSKYHRKDCSRAKNANEKMSITTAIERGYSPCSYCF